MRGGRIGARTKLLIWLIMPSLILEAAIILLAQSNTTSFLRQTQDGALNGMVVQSVRLMESQMNDLVLNVLGIEDEILYGEKVPADWVRSMEAAAQTRPELVRGVVYLRNDGLIVGYPEYFWDSFAQKEMNVIRAQTKNSNMGVVWSEPFTSTMGSTGLNSLVSIVTKQVIDEEGKQEGVLAFVTDVTSIVQRSAAFAGNYDTRTLLYDQKDRLIYSITIVARNSYETLEYAERNTQTLSAAKANFERNDEYYVISDMKQAPFWKVVIVGDVKTLENKYRPIVQFAIMILLLGSAGLIFLYIGVSWWFTKPITSLTKGIRHIATGHLDHTFEVVRQDEFGEMAREFNRMMRTIQELIETLKQTEEQKRQADFQMLLAQINPHFLYNTLNTIDIMVDFKGKEEIHRVMTVLIRLLKYGLDRTNVLRRLDEELTYVKDYLYIQSVRYEDSFEFNVEDMDEKLGSIPVLKLVLQPIVENAVFHGLRPLTGRKGKLTVTVRPSGKELEIIVADNGVGMSKDKLDGLLQAAAGIDTETINDGNHIGFRNVHERVQLYYGVGYGLGIESDPQSGTIVTVKLRVIETEDGRSEPNRQITAGR
ncbi:sensor histidine kinase [Paenibacillus baekrokdamisoli]|uniref:Sensor histidine kinase n=1 Tax=Paenibacillus baekrokdamisoli TaxID=1712516 RepID=A0A3G9J1J4_9BACL|nr:histidine kinase [Paenibacillus baekrokdamisoli]MBB3070815.1 sensor histidine kinase YesM [Paenibacillus baekrokdamisoli]BBH22245.1 sensor histidine kinase [Paenibacillus baekrokdamisoli]